MNIEPKVMLSPYVSAHSLTIKYLARLAKKDDVSLDLGSGEGDVPLTFAEYGVKKAWGIEVDDKLVDEAILRIKERNMEERVGIIHNCIFRVNLWDIEPNPTLVTVNFAWGSANTLRSKLIRELETGTRIYNISNGISKGMEGWKTIIDPFEVPYSHDFIHVYEIGKI